MHIIPFYYSFKEFKDNYQTDLENWLSVYEDADENAFIEILKHKYSFHKDNYELYYIGDVYPEKENVTLDMFIDQLISNLINLLERNVTISDIHTNMFIVGDFLRFNYGYGKGYFFENDFLREFDTIYSNGVDFISDPNTFFENNQFSFLKGFIEVDFENMTLKPNFIKHDNYYYAQNKIQHFIFEKITIDTEKALEEENQRKIEARQEYNQLVIEKLAERKEKQKKEEELKQDLLVKTIVSKIEATLKVKRDESSVKLSRSEGYVHDVFKSELVDNFRKDIFRNQYYNDLFYYLVENYYNPNKDKYIQIFRYIDSLQGFICSQSYFIKFIKETFDVSISKITEEKHNDNIILKERQQEFNKSN